MADFLYYLLSVRGEFSRLLLALADAERVQQERLEAAFEGRGPVVIIDPAAPDAPQLPPPWWDDPERLACVVEQLRRCLAVFELIRFPTIVVLRGQDLAMAGVEVVGTFRTPHVTLAHADADELVRRLLGCEHTERANPYHVAEQPGKDRA